MREMTAVEGDDSCGGRWNAGGPRGRKGASCRPAGYLRVMMLIVWKVGSFNTDIR